MDHSGDEDSVLHHSLLLHTAQIHPYHTRDAVQLIINHVSFSLWRTLVLLTVR